MLDTPLRFVAYRKNAIAHLLRGRLELWSRVPVFTEKDLRHSFSRQRKG